MTVGFCLRLQIKLLIMNKLEFLDIYLSPFKSPKMKFYFGKTNLGTPYFLPRKFVKNTPENALKEAKRRQAEMIYERDNNPENPFTSRIPTIESIIGEMKYDRIPVTKRFSIDLVPLGYKTKWSETDYRFEWSPRLSIVAFGYQFAITWMEPVNSIHFWEAFLFYNNHIKHLSNRTMREKVTMCRNLFPLSFTEYKRDSKRTFNDYDVILKKKYL